MTVLVRARLCDMFLLEFNRLWVISSPSIARGNHDGLLSVCRRFVLHSGSSPAILADTLVNESAQRGIEFLLEALGAFADLFAELALLFLQSVE